MKRRKRLTKDQWLHFKMGEGLKPEVVFYARKEAERTGEPVHEVFDKLMRIYLTSFYFALPPKKERSAK